MKVLTSHQMQEADKATLIAEKIVSDQLMERASAIFSNWVINYLDKKKTILIVCGTGNNGGDGLCIARMLFQKGFEVSVATFSRGKFSPDYSLNLQQLKKYNIPLITLEENAIEFISDYEIIIDAIFGTGLNRAPEGLYAMVIDVINKSNAKCISVDVPSGFSTDNYFDWNCIQADYCLTFETPKLGFFFPENYKHLHSWKVASIGLDTHAIESANSSHYFLTADDLNSTIKPRKTFDHKGIFGNVLIIAGSEQMTGAALLCAYAALKTGCGLVTIANDNPSFIYPELMFIPTENIVEFISENKIKRIGIGPGLGVNTNTEILVKNIFTNAKSPLVIDADALNIIAKNKTLFSSIPANSILTPHPGEFERLFGTTENSFDRLELQIKKSQELQLIIIYKTAFTCITLPDGTAWFNSTGNPGMATGGSGDVLTGIITSFLAQGYSESDAAKLGVYLHGLAGDIAMETLQQVSLIASDIIQFIPKAIKQICE